MNIAFEINHPGQVHLLKNAYLILSERGHNIFVFAKEEQIISRLLNYYKIPFNNLGQKGQGIRGKFFNQLLFDFRLLKEVVRNQIQIGVGSSITNDHVSLLSRMKAIHLSDDDEEIVPLMTRFSYPFSDTILTPSSLKFKRFTNKTITYAGTHELSYLHPNHFTPDINVLNEASIDPKETFFIIRFVQLKGHHDKGHSGISYGQKKGLITLLSKYGRVIITSEKDIESDFEHLKLPVPPEKIHSLMHYSSLFVGDSQTMTSEAAILGIPAFKCNTFAGRLSIPNHLENKYGLCFSYQPKDFPKMLSDISGLLEKRNFKNEWLEKRERFLSDSIDVTAFFVWFIENFPESKRIMKENPEYQYRFK